MSDPHGRLADMLGVSDHDPHPDSREIVDIATVSSITGLATQTLYNLRSRKEGPPSFSLRGRVRYYLADVHAWIADEAAR